MPSQAHAKYDPLRDGVRIAVTRGEPGSPRLLLKWGTQAVEIITDDMREPDESAWLTLQDDDARAIYEALADHFGHTGHDMRSLRRDYDAERGRVDRLISHLIAPSEERAL